MAMSKIERLRDIVANHQARKIERVLVDATTAAAVLLVYDRISPENRAKYEAMPLVRMADVAWKIIK